MGAPLERLAHYFSCRPRGHSKHWSSSCPPCSFLKAGHQFPFIGRLPSCTGSGQCEGRHHQTSVCIADVTEPCSPPTFPSLPTLALPASLRCPLFSVKAHKHYQ